MKQKPQKSASLSAFTEKLFNTAQTPPPIRALQKSIADDKKLSIGRFRPWSWFIELTHGCNLACGFCAARLLGKNIKCMSLETWKQTIDIIAEVSPICRIDMANLGEPTLNPNIFEMFRYAKQKCPTIQLLMYTNGVTLIKGEITYKQLFDSGLNMIFIDMYAPKEKHLALAKASGVQIVIEDEPKPDDINIFEYHGDPNVKAIRLSRNPGDWLPKKRRRWQTWLNNLDWKIADKMGMKPVEVAPSRRCDQPFKYPNIYYDGAYSLCCQDGMREIAGQIGNVSDGTDGFFKYWFGEYMQGSRRMLDNKNRADHPLCSRCKMADGRCDVPMWRDRDDMKGVTKNNLLDYYWDGAKWIKLEPYQKK
jgi:hypothetical protein